MSNQILKSAFKNCCMLLSDYNPERVVAEDEEYELPDDVYDTKGLFDDGQEGKQDNEGLLYDDINNNNELQFQGFFKCFKCFNFNFLKICFRH